MPDLIEDANHQADLFLRASLANRQACELKPTGKCHYCLEEVSPGHLFCAGQDCSGDWHEEQRRKKISGKVK